MTFLSPFNNPFCHASLKSHSYESTLKNSVTWKIMSAGGVCLALRLISGLRCLKILKTRSPNSKVLYSSRSTSEILDWNGGSFNKSTIYLISSEEIVFF